jgi:hypothetical protein
MRKKQKSITQLKKEVQIIFNTFIRNRDTLLGQTFICISCGKEFPISKMQAGHLFTVKGYQHLRFNEFNVNGQCSGCNGFNKNHQIWYAINLKEKIGENNYSQLLNDAVDRPEKDWTREELEQLKQHYKNLI